MPVWAQILTQIFLTAFTVTAVLFGFWFWVVKPWLAERIQDLIDTANEIEPKEFSLRSFKHLKQWIFYQIDRDILQDIFRAKASKSWRDKLWLIMEIPNSSRAAAYVQRFLLLCIILSVLTLTLETLPELKTYGESSDHCQKVCKDM